MTYHKLCELFMLISSSIINELGKFWQISVTNKVYFIFVCTQIFQKVFLCMNIRYDWGYDMFILSKTEEIM